MLPEKETEQKLEEERNATFTASPDRNGGGWLQSEHGEKRELHETKKQGSREGARERGVGIDCN